MLKNKFGMTKVLVLVLSVLMLVSLVACDKADGPSTDDMNAAIQAAIDAANAEQAAKEAALAASIAADKAAQEAKEAALAESMAKEKAENDAALKKAQEEAKAAADAAAAASKAAKEAADKAAKDAADAAAKAAKEAADKAAKEASEAAKKAQEAAEKQASELAAALEAAKAEALKAAEEAAKAQAEASKAIEEAAKAAEEAAKAQAEASKAKEEAAVVSSQLAETTVVPETTVVAPAETTVAPETTTEAPAVPVDKTEVLAAYSKLKTEYTYTKQDMYKADDYAELVLLFDKASLDLNNAASVEAATAVLETLKVDAAAIRSVENAAAEVAALVNALGDIETEVFTTQATKIDEALKAYTALKVEYAEYLDYDVKAKADKDGDTVKIATKLGINVADLNKAEDKIVVLKGYIEAALHNDMEQLYGRETSIYAKLSRFDAEDAEPTTIAIIKDAHYKYLVLSVINGGDVAAADLPIDWEDLVVDGEVQKNTPDYDKPIAWFTTEELIDVFVLPVLDLDFDKAVNDASTGLIKKFTDAIKALDTDDYFTGTAAELDLEDIIDALTDELAALSYVDDYKGNVTVEDALIDVHSIAIEYHIEALNAYLEAAKVVAIEKNDDLVERNIETIEDAIDDIEDQISNTESASTIERLNTKIDKEYAKIDTLKANKEAYTANVKAAALLTVEEMLNEELNETKAYKDKWADITNFEDYTYAQMVTFLNLVLKNTIADNFANEIKVEAADASEEELFTLIEKTVEDLELLRLRVSPFEDDKSLKATLAAKGTTDLFIDTWRGSKVDYIEGYFYNNTAKFEAMVAIIDTAIAEIEAKAEAGYANKQEPVQDKDGNPLYFKNVDAYNYAVEKELTLNDILKNNKSLYSKDATEFPITYTYTGSEQAAKEVADIYVKACEDVDSAMRAIVRATKDYKTDDLKKTITGDADYKAIVATVAGTLKDEVEAVQKTYTNKIVEEADKFSNNSSLTKDSIFAKVNKQDAGSVKDADYVKVTPSKANFATKYNPLGYQSKVASLVKEFKLNFYALKDGIVDIENTYVDETKLVENLNLNVCKVVQLWNLKLEAAEDIADLMATYKNSFVANIGNDGVATGTYTLKANKAGLYYYDGVAGNAYFEKSTGKADDPTTTDKDESKEIVPEVGSVNDKVIAKSAAAIAYEAELDALLKEYTDKIMGLKLSDVSYSIAKAEEKIAAYKTELFGTHEKVSGTDYYRDYVVTANNNPDKNVMHYRANSKIFTAYNTYILENTYGKTRVPVNVEITVTVEGDATGVTKTATVSNAYYLDFFSISAGKATEYKDGVVKTYGTYVKSIVVKKDGVEIHANEDGQYFADDLDAEYTVDIVVERATAKTSKPSISVSIDGGHARIIHDENNTGFGDSTYKFKVVVENGYKITNVTGGATQNNSYVSANGEVEYSFTVDGAKKNEVKVYIGK